MADNTDPDHEEAQPAADAKADDDSTVDDRPTEREREFAQMQRRLNEREMGLDQRSAELDRREEKIDTHEAELDRREAELDEREYRLDEREATLNDRETDLDEREAELTEYDAQLSERATELDEHEETLNTYLSGQMADVEASITETMHDALDRYEADRSAGRFGPTGTMLVGLAGVALVVAGIGFGALASAGTAPFSVGGTTANLVLAAVIGIVGLALNLGTVAGKI
ncbi:Rnase Y domain-containing protein [Haloarcula sp. NS06]|uniref:Rnase Y domain-containing protein n=1 Tax=unclassified Haloarcula TaxID=2624677 RepID=UPI0027B7392F|nr:Rnase Y domain-containing protein [Haloarcula sp. H-GB4]MDQ2070943.1 Rnase Y domain-containing protein [Haloarcula sp. H-GB4]